MADFGFVGASYEAPSIYQDAQECINWFPEIDPTKPQGSRGVIALYPTPGLTTVATLSPQAEVRGMRTVSGGQYMVAVCGAYVYVLNSTFTPTIVGQLNTSTGQVGITDNGQNVYIVDGSYRYTWRISNPNSAVFEGTISGTTLTFTTAPVNGVKIQIRELGVADIQDVFARTNSNSAFLRANSSFTQANAAFLQANSGFTQSNSGFLQANSSFTQANAAYAKANTGTTLGKAIAMTIVFGG